MPKDTYKYELRYDETDMNKNIKLVSLLNFMQDVAKLNAEKYGFGPEFIFSHNMAWFVLKYRIEVYEKLNNLESIEIETESRGGARLFAYRDFNFFNNGKLIAKANSLWAIVDFQTKKMLKPQEILNNFTAYEKRENDIDFGKIPAIDNPESQKEFRIRFDDIDINQHVNNSNYVAWALETLSFDFRKNNTVKNVDIYYKKDIGLDEKIISQLKYDEQTNTTLHSIKNANNNDELCSLKIEWEKQ